MDDDFNTREAIATLLGMIREISKLVQSGLDDQDLNAVAHYAVELLEEVAGASLGLLPTREQALLVPTEDPRKAMIKDQVESLLNRRKEARASKDWSTADAIRDELTELGVVVTDTTDGPVWDLI